MVDDQEFDRVLFARLLRDTGVSNPCVTFSRGEDLIDALIEVLRGAPAPLLCFLDVKMAGMNGFDVLRWIRCQHACDEIPVVMLSSSNEPRDLGEAHHCGAQCYVAKFPQVDQMSLILREAERVAASAAAGPFKLPCNLLLPVAQAVC
jgi:CheY-like chemotaxis protein